MELTQSDRAALEKLIDKYTADSVFSAIETICYEKAAHLRETWQDAGQARLWERAAKHSARAASYIYAIGFPVSLRAK